MNTPDDMAGKKDLLECEKLVLEIRDLKKPYMTLPFIAGVVGLIAGAGGLLSAVVALQKTSTDVVRAELNAQRAEIDKKQYDYDKQLAKDKLTEIQASREQMAKERDEAKAELAKTRASLQKEQGEIGQAIQHMKAERDRVLVQMGTAFLSQPTNVEPGSRTVALAGVVSGQQPLVQWQFHRTFDFDLKGNPLKSTGFTPPLTGSLAERILQEPRIGFETKGTLVDGALVLAVKDGKVISAAKTDVRGVFTLQFSAWTPMRYYVLHTDYHTVEGDLGTGTQPPGLYPLMMKKLLLGSSLLK